MAWVKRAAVNLLRDVAGWRVAPQEWVKVEAGRTMHMQGMGVLPVDGLMRLDGAVRVGDV